MVVCSVSALNAKTWSVTGKALINDTTLLVQNATNPALYTFVGNLTNLSFKLYDGVNYFIPACGMNDPLDQQVGIEKQADASQTGFRVSYVSTNKPYRISLTDGVAPKLIVEKVTPYGHIYLIGGPVNTHDPNWLLSDARELEKDPGNPFVFYYRGFLKYNTFGDERGAIKFLTSNLAWDPSFHPKGTGNVPLAQASKMISGGADTKWEIPADGSGNGYYVIKLNTLDETIHVEQFQPANVDYPSNIFITGNAMPCGWVNTTPEIMTPTNILEGKYSWTGNVLPGQFKFLKTKGSWGSCYVSTKNDQPVVYDQAMPLVYESDYINNGGNDFKFLITEPGRCTVNVDLAAMQLKVQKENQNSTGNVTSGDGVIITGVDGKIVVKCASDFRKNLAVFAIDGRKIYSDSFVFNSEVALPKGSYIVKVDDNTGKDIVRKIVF